MRFAGICLALVTLIFAVGGHAARAQEPAWFGAETKTVTPAVMAEEGLAVPFGALVTEVEPDSPAAAAGIAAGDVVISANGTPVTSAEVLKSAVAKLEAGAALKLDRMRGSKAGSVSVTLAARAAPPEAHAAATPTGQPQLMIDTGGHMALIKDLYFTADGKQLVSASVDKTIRIWDLATGKTVRMIRGEMSPGDPGKIYTMALSPNGKWLAAGGWTGSNEIRLYDFATGELVTLLKGHGNVVHGLAFSPDSKYLISGAGDSDAIIWDVEKGSLKHRLKGHKDSIYAVGFSPDSTRAITGSFDRTLRLWSVADGSEITFMTGHQDRIRSLAVAPDGRIASGDQAGKIWLWDGKTGAYIQILASQGTDVGSMNFSPDGKYLLTSCSQRHPCLEHVWEVATGEEIANHKIDDDIVLATAISPDGRWAASGGGNNHEIHVWDLKTGKMRLKSDGTPLILAGVGKGVYAAGFSADNHRIGWGNKDVGTVNSRREPYQFALTLPIDGGTLGRPVALTEAEGEQFRRAEPARGSITLSHRKGGDYGYDAILDIKDGDAIRTTIERGPTDGFDHRAYTVTPVGDSIVSGGMGGTLATYDLDGKELGEYIGHTGDVWAVTTTTDGRYMISGSADQTMGLWNLKTQELIVTFFYGSNGEWVMWTPQGYYTGSPGGGELVGWQINQGADREALYVRGRQLRDKLLRPDIVERAIVLASAEAALEEAGLRNVSVETLLTHTPPVVMARAWEPEAVGGRGVVIVATEKNALPILDTKITVSDGKQETTVKARPKALPPGTPQPEKDATLRAFEVPLFRGENTVRIVVVNAAGESEKREVAITHNGEGELDTRGTLWVLVVGADKYPGAKNIADHKTGKAFKYPDLKYAGADAAAFAETAVAEMKARHSKTDVTVLVNGGPDGEPTRANILAAFARIRANSADSDTIVILLAGHGENWQQGRRFHFLPSDFKRTVMTDIGENVIDWKDDIQPVIAEAKGRKILFLDACYSANAYNKTLLQDADADRFVAFSAAAPGQQAREFDQEGHGAFTYMLIEALKGAKAALDPLENGVTIYKLGDYVNLKVRERTFGKQTPEFRSGQGNFVLTRM